MPTSAPQPLEAGLVVGSRKSIVPLTWACISAPPSSSLRHLLPDGAFTSAGPARYKPEPSVISSLSQGRASSRRRPRNCP